MSKKYSVLNRTNHDNADYEIGSTIELEDDQAAPLLKVAAIELNATAPSAKANKKSDAAVAEVTSMTANATTETTA